MPGWKELEDIAVGKLIAKGKLNEDQARKQHRNNKHKQIKRVVECIDLCKSLGEKFDGEIRWAGGRDTLIQVGSAESHIIADALEAGNSFRMTVSMVNDYLIKEGKPEVGYTPVYTCCQKMKPKVIKFAKR